MRAFANSLAEALGHEPQYSISMPSYHQSMEMMGLEVASVAGVKEILDQPINNANENDQGEVESDLPLLLEDNSEEAAEEDFTADERQMIKLHVQNWKQVYETTLVSRGVKSTMALFTQYMAGNPWLDFEKEGSTSDIAEAEHKLFVEMMDKYDRNADLGNKIKGYKKFEFDWNQEAGKRMKRVAEGESDDILVNRKKADDLVRYYDRLLSNLRASDTHEVAQPEYRQLIRDLKASGVRNTGAIRFEQAEPQQYAEGPDVPPGYCVDNAGLFAQAIQNRESTGNQAPYTVQETVEEQPTETTRQRAITARPEEVQEQIVQYAAANREQQVQQQQQQHQAAVAASYPPVYMPAQPQPYYYPPYHMHHYHTHYQAAWQQHVPQNPYQQTMIQQNTGQNYMVTNPVKEHIADFREICRQCGYFKREHNGNENFGKGRCKITQCNYCKQMLISHIAEARRRNYREDCNDDLMGYHCIFTTTNHEKNLKNEFIYIHSY
jgi:hypothetical protein